jgi:hypothetical protein
MRVPGGDIVERVWAFSDPVAGPVLAVEMSNEGRVPVALALAVRPYGPEGAARIDSVDVDDVGIRVNGSRAVWLPKPASRTAVSTWDQGDVAEVVLAGDAADSTVASARCPDGFAQATVVMPLALGTSFVVLVPLDVDTVGPTWAAPPVVPPADAVARGWASHASRAVRVVLPDAEVAGVLTASTSQILLAGAGTRLDGGDARTAAAVAGALDHLGLHDEVDPIVATVPDGQGHGGQLGGDSSHPAATGAVLVAAGRHWELGRDAALVEALAGPLAAGAHHRPGSGRLLRRAAPLDALSAAWQVAGARHVAAALDDAGQADAAAAVRNSLEDLMATIEAGRDDIDVVDALDLIWLGIVAADSDDADEVIESLRSTHLHGGAVLRRAAPVGLSPERTARLAAIELKRRDAAALERLRWLVEVAGTRRSWPEAVNPRTGAGCAGDGWSAAAAASVVDLVLDLLVCIPDRGKAEVALLPVLPVDWLGAGIEAHGVRTALGAVSFAVRWHGERPALLWEIEPHDGVGPVRLTAPGLEPGWSTTERKGDALLAAPVPLPDAVSAGVDDEDNGVGPDTSPGDGDPPEQGLSFS